MSREHFRDIGEASSFGSVVYDRAVPPGHFLSQLRELVDWDALTQE